MKKIIFILSLVFLSTNVFANDAKINEFTDWLFKNGHTQYVKEVDICKEYKKYSKEWYDSHCEGIINPFSQQVSYPKGKMEIISNLDINFYKYGEIPWGSKPNRDTALYYLYRGQEVESVNDRAGSIKSDNPYKFEISLRAEDDKTLKEVRKAMNKTSMLSYLLYEDGKITIDEITPKDRFGILYDNNTVHTSASVGKSLVSYVTGHAICEGYISSIDHKLNDWELLENTLFYDQKLIDLLNMAAGHHQYADFNIKTGGLYPSNGNKNTIAFHMKDGVFKNSKKSNSKYQYTNLISSIVINYVWHKSDGNFQDLLDKVFKEKAKIENDVWFEKNNNETIRRENQNNKIKKEYEVRDEDGPIRYSVQATRYDYLRIAKAMLDDWQNDTCVGKYLKTIHERRIPKNNKWKDDNSLDLNSRSYAGHFHTNFSGISSKKRNVMGMSGYGGQSIMIDFDLGRIVVINSIHTDYNWKKIAHSVIKEGK
ncbi:MAG: hypothetical protein O3C64_05855 [Proteobacteria bacterium]|nr:hypothetical protein [Pseudomonadota bacterium]